LEKAQRKAEEKARLDAERAVNVAPQRQENGAPARAADPSDPKEYFNSRVQMITNLREAGVNPFPHKFDVSISLRDFNSKYEHVKTEEVLTDVEERIAGTLTILVYLILIF
jgi:lysyl-tRNA synthetase class 2